MEIGKKLREAREEKGLTIEQLQERTKIRKKYLVAIENDNYDPIPGTVYVKAFIKGYAEEVGLNGSQLAQDYQRWVEEQENEIVEDEEIKENKPSLTDKFNSIFKNKVFRVIIILILLAVIGFIAYNYFFENSTVNTVQAPVKNSLENTQKNQSINDKNNNSIVDEDMAKKTNNKSNENKKINDSSNDTTGKNITGQGITKLDSKKDKKELKNEIDKQINNQDKKSNNINYNNNLDNGAKPNTNQLKKTSNKQIEQKTIKIIADDRSWFQLSIDGENTFQGFIDKGEVKNYKGSNIISIKIGNGSAVKVQIGGKVYGPWGETGEVIKQEISLSN